MSNRILRCVLLACVVAFAGLWASQSLAQTTKTAKPPLYTYVAEWSVPRAQWGSMEKSGASVKTVMDQLMADGTLVGYGSFENVVHQEGQPTHGSWFQAMSMASLMKTLAAIKAAGGSSEPVFAASKHWDIVLESTHYGYQPGAFKNSYLRVGHWIAKPGREDTVDQSVTALLVPMLDKLLADGAIHGYQIDHEAIHSGDPGEISMAIITNGPDGLDKFNAAIEEADKNSPLAAVAFDGAVDESGHRDTLSLVPSFTHK